MMKVFSKINKKGTGIFAAGVLFGTAGIKVLSGRDAKKVYVSCTAAVLRAKESIMKTVTNIQENAEDIYAEAKAVNEEREAEMVYGEDCFEEASDCDEKKDEGEAEEATAKEGATI